MTAGVNVSYIDVAKQMGYTESDIRNSIQEGKRAYSKMRRGLVDITDPKEKVEQEARINQFRSSLINLQVELREVAKWKEERGIPRTYGRQQANTRESRAQLTAEERQDIINDIDRE
jgi:predicted transcriptional regulator